MCSNVYQALTKPELSWICCQCGLPNFSTSLFESFDISCSNNFDSLYDTSASSVFSDIGDPITTSSPKATAPCKRKINTDNIKVLTINFQSIKAKRESFWNLVESSKPDVILGCETWLKPTISNQEIAPPGYSIYRKDRDDGYGGVLVAVKSNFISSEVDIAFQSELVAVQVEGTGSSPLIIASLYRQPNRNIDHTISLCNDIRSIANKFKEKKKEI